MSIEKELEIAISAAFAAGKEILKVYDTAFEVIRKNDNTPLTLADQNAHRIISLALKETGLPVLSEEGRDIPFSERAHWNRFWMVDPLDGTKEFVKRNGEFTVNIALIGQNTPQAGIIYVPVKDVMYFGIAHVGSYKVDNFSRHNDAGGMTAWQQSAHRLPSAGKKKSYTVVGSRSHKSPETAQFMDELRLKHGNFEIVSMGSSLKICLVAEGIADIYPRFAPTMEWDTAAGHAIALGAGKDITDHRTGKSMKYNKENLLNNWFIVE